MAFNSLMQLTIAKLSNNFHEKSKVVEWGNQRFKYNKGTIDHINSSYNLNIPHTIKYVWEYYENFGFDEYVAIDVNTELKAIAMDLNYILVDEYNYAEQFDLVTNNGTGEHIFDQRTVFENMHNLCKVGGIMLNVLPLSPWVNHGFYNYNPVLFRDIVTSNQYEWCAFLVGRNSGEIVYDIPTDINSWGFYDQSPPKNPMSQMESVIEKTQKYNSTFTNISIVTAYKKIKEDKFKIPMQGRYVNDMLDSIKKTYTDSNIDTRQTNHHSAGY